MKNLKNNGFTLVELLVAVGIMAVILPGMIKLFIYTSVSAELSGNKTLAISEAHNKIEEIRNYAFDSIVADYASEASPGDSFDLVNLTGKGVVSIDATNAELLVVEVVISYLNKYGRIIGEDIDFDGVLDDGEDTNGNGKIDSPVTVISYLTRR